MQGIESYSEPKLAASILHEEDVGSSFTFAYMGENCPTPASGSNDVQRRMQLLGSTREVDGWRCRRGPAQPDSGGDGAEHRRRVATHLRRSSRSCKRARAGAAPY